jgi:hypothetical protein
MINKKMGYCYLLFALFLYFGCKKEPPLPILETKVANVFGRSATSGGTFITRKSAAIHEMGVCWSRNKNPSIDDYRSNEGPVYTTDYFSVMECLAPGTEYYYRAYAISSEGVAYGNTFKLKTKADSSSFLQTDSIKFLTLRTVRAYAFLDYPRAYDQIG